MINQDLLKITGQLKSVVGEQMEMAKKAISNIPDGEVKTDLQNLLQKASSGKVAYSDVQRELEKIMSKCQ